jgi:hypothetical protein
VCLSCTNSNPEPTLLLCHATKQRMRTATTAAAGELSSVPLPAAGITILSMLPANIRPTCHLHERLSQKQTCTLRRAFKVDKRLQLEAVQHYRGCRPLAGCGVLMLVQPLVLLRRVKQTRETRNLPATVQARLRGRQTGNMGRSRHEPPPSKGSKPPQQQQQQYQKSSVLSQLDISTKPNRRVEALLGWDIFQVLQLRMQTRSATSTTVHCALVQLARSEHVNQPLFH